MSTLKVDAIRHNSATSDAITTAADGTCTAKLTSVNGGQLSHRNKVINGGMLINQRASSYTSTGGEYTLDRFNHASGSAFTFDTTTTQDSSTPDGFSKSLKITPDSTQTPTGSHNGTIRQVFEGQDFQDLSFGTSSAKSVTVSFYAKSSSQNNNHQYGVQLRCRSGSTTQYVSQAFTVTSSWQRFTMTFVGNTGVAIRNDTSVGFEICFHLASGPDDIVSAKSTWTTSAAFQTVTGQSNFMDNTSNEFYLTGVQLEVGDTATSFEHRSFGEELSRCQRYYYQVGGQTNDGQPDEPYGVLLPMAMNADATRVKGVLTHPFPMRVGPSVSGGGSGACLCQCGDVSSSTVLVFQAIWTASNTARHTWVDMSPNSGTVGLTGETGVVYANNSTYHFKVTAEF